LPHLLLKNIFLVLYFFAYTWSLLFTNISAERTYWFKLDNICLVYLLIFLSVFFLLMEWKPHVRTWSYFQVITNFKYIPRIYFHFLLMEGASLCSPGDWLLLSTLSPPSLPAWTLPRYSLSCPHYSVCAESGKWYTNIISKNVSNYSNYFAEIAEETEGQFLPLPVIPAGKEEQILSNFEVEPSTKNEVTFVYICHLLHIY
jgi:hypothetical protein